MECSKAIFNTGLYCQRLWFSRVLPIIFDNYIEKLDTHLKQFSPLDKGRLFDYLIFKKDVKNINKILGYVRESEKAIINVLIEKAKHFIKGCELIEPNFVKTTKTAYTYDFQKTVDIFNTIGIDKFKDEYGDFSEFIEKIKKALTHKIDNQKKTADKKKKIIKDEEPEEPKEPVKQVKSTRNRKSSTTHIIAQPTNACHLIPSGYMNTDVLEAYVKNIDSYKMICAQVAQQTLKKLDESFKSFFALKKAGLKANPPKYLKSNERYVLIFQNTSFKIESEYDGDYGIGKYARLSLGKDIKSKIMRLDKKNDGYIRFKVPKNIIDCEINEIELTPIKDKSTVLVNFKYSKSVPVTTKISGMSDRDIDNKDTATVNADIEADDAKTNADNEKIISVLDKKNINKISFDLGMVNLMTGYSPILDKPVIYKGGCVMYINKIYKNLIEGLHQSRLKKVNKQDSSKHTNVLWRRRNDRIKDHFNKISSDVIKLCKENGITEIIIGYNKNWKNGVNMGKVNNDGFYKIPYRSLVHMIFNKAEENGITVVETNESYTSKCDAVNQEEIKWHEAYSGERKRRGLFESGKHVLVNADVNGAINIMRKAIKDMPVIKKLLERKLKDYSKICNPEIRKFAP